MNLELLAYNGIDKEQPILDVILKS